MTLSDESRMTDHISERPTQTKQECIEAATKVFARAVRRIYFSPLEGAVQVRLTNCPSMTHEEAWASMYQERRDNLIFEGWSEEDIHEFVVNGDPRYL